jgi:hypothetical protein
LKEICVPKGPALSVLAAILAAGCASGGDGAEPPAWFVERAAELNREGYPELANVPERVDANLDAAHWEEVRRELDAERAAMQQSPRSGPPPSPDAQAAAADAFDENARADIEATRLKH